MVLSDYVNITNCLFHNNFNNIATLSASTGGGAISTVGSHNIRYLFLMICKLVQGINYNSIINCEFSGNWVPKGIGGAVLIYGDTSASIEVFKNFKLYN